MTKLPEAPIVNDWRYRGAASSDQ